MELRKNEKPVVISLGGSMLFKEKEIDDEYVKKICELFIKLKREDREIAVVVGGGYTAKEYCRAIRKLSENEFYADRIAIEGTKMNAMLLIAVLGDEAYPKVIVDLDDAFYALEHKLIPVGAGILEGLTTDTDAVLLAERLGASSLVNLSNVQAIYSEDPQINPSAKKYSEMTHQQLVDLAMIADKRQAKTKFVFDLIASKLAARSNLTLHFIYGKKFSEIEKAIKGEKHDGTTVRN